ncbi:MAG: hypothetical protein KJ621_05145 [Proteobacteria bacterium]|nr:hypothetical protein [Pseudomonadota bacterium]MBU1742015.1 hypothetical protein [Pseudomonadota bacterium]
MRKLLIGVVFVTLIWLTLGMASPEAEAGVCSRQSASYAYRCWTGGYAGPVQCLHRAHQVYGYCLARRMRACVKGCARNCTRHAITCRRSGQSSRYCISSSYRCQRRCQWRCANY